MPPRKGARYRTDQKTLIAAGQKYCPKCDQVLPLDRFSRNKSTANGYESHCRSCRSRAGNRVALDRMNETRFLRRYGITVEQRDALLRDQGGKCAICKRPLTRPCLDHDHATGRARGLLCQQCNTLIGMSRDTVAILQAAISYLEEHRGQNLR